MAGSGRSKDLNIVTRPEDFEQLPTVPPWTGPNDASVEAVIATNPALYSRYFQTLQANYHRLVNHVDNTMAPNLRNQFEEMKEYTNLIEEENAQANNDNIVANNDLAMTRAKLAAAENSHQHGSSSASRSAKAPEPPQFSGDDKTLTKPFLFIARNKVRANRDHFVGPDEITTQLNMIGYVFSRFTSTAASRTMSLVENNRFPDIESFFTHIQRAFGDPNPIATAQAKIRECKQKNKPFQDYLAEFQMYINDTGYNDVAQQTAFYEGLSTELKGYLVTMPWRDMDMITFQEECARLEIAYKSIPTYTSKGARSNNRTSSAPAAPAPVVHSTTSVTASPAGDPMDLSANRVRRGPLSAAEKQARRDRGECLYCGVAGHFASNCPNKPAIRSVSVTSNTPANSQSNPGTPQPARVVQGNA